MREAVSVLLTSRLKEVAPALQGRIQPVGVDGLGNVIVHPGSEAAFAVTGHDVGRHRQDRGVLPDAFPLAQQPGGGRRPSITGICMSIRIRS